MVSSMRSRGINIYICLNYATRKLAQFRKLARFRKYPGKTHSKMLLHLLLHLLCHRLKEGIKFYSDITKSPFYRHLTTTGNNKFADYPIVVYSDASFQDFPDSGRSTGAFLYSCKESLPSPSNHLPALIYSPPVVSASDESTHSLLLLLMPKVHRLNDIVTQLQTATSDRSPVRKTFQETTLTISYEQSLFRCFE
jgi:hypothetical protein